MRLTHKLETRARSFGLSRAGKALTALLAAALLSGCSGFGREWRAAAKQPTPTNDITGRWEGRWVSASNGHHGKLRCVMTRATGDLCLARFHATYAGVFSFGYTATLNVTNDVAGFRLNGEADLGKLAGGVYRYDGLANPTNFLCRYQAADDHGRFEMTRPTH